MHKTEPTWTLGDDMQGFYDYTNKIVDMFPQKIAIACLVSGTCQYFSINETLMWIWMSTIGAAFVVAMLASFKQNSCFSHKDLQTSVMKFVACGVYGIIAAVGGKALNIPYDTHIPFMDMFLAVTIMTDLKIMATQLDSIGLRPPASFMILLRIFNKKEKELLVQLGDTPEDAKSTCEDEKDKT